KVVTSTTDLYDIAKAVGGDKIKAVHIGEGYQDPHFIEAKPSFILQLRDADVFAFVRLDLEIGWMQLLLEGARNPKMMFGGPVVAWHTSWRYFAEYNGMNIVAFMEPKPGVPPSPSHLVEVINAMKRTGAKVIVMEPFYDRKTADLVARQTNAKVLILPPSVGGVPGVTDYVQLMKYDMDALASTLRAAGE